jgi:hypothetical protein
MVRHLAVPDRPQQNCIKPAQLLQTVYGHHDAVLQIVLAAIGKRFKFNFKTIARGQGLQYPYPLGDNFPADSVSGDQGDFKYLI